MLELLIELCADCLVIGKLGDRIELGESVDFHGFLTARLILVVIFFTITFFFELD